MKEFSVIEGEKRIDAYLKEKLPEYSRSYLQKLLKEAHVFVDGTSVKPNFKLKKGQQIQVHLPEIIELDVFPEDIPLDILYEDEDLIIVNKPKNMVVHPSNGHPSKTLVNALLHHCKGNLSGINGVLRPGIVHRIDRNTTGSLVVCKNDIAHQNLSQQLKEHRITRIYEAIVHGRWKEKEGRMETMIGRHPVERKKMSVHCKQGKIAITNYKVLEEFSNYSYIQCRLETGRTHQIRVHMAHIGHPILGDEVYGPKKLPIPNLMGQTLHAKTLGFFHPRTKKYLEVEAPLPEYFQTLLHHFRKEK